MCLTHTQQNVLRFDIRVYDTTLSVEVVYSKENLMYDPLDGGEGQPPVITLDDRLEKIASQHFEHHAHVWSMFSQRNWASTSTYQSFAIFC